MKKDGATGGMRISQAWKRKTHFRSDRLPDQLQDLEREDPESRRYGGVPTFTPEEMQDRRPPGRR
jgi:hypothetical protein